MKALVYHGPGKIVYEDYPDPVIEDDHNLIIAVTKCSICGSDLHPYHGDKIGTTDYAQPVEKFCTGHEMIGEVVEIGKAVSKHKVGDTILVEAGAACGTCKNCKRGFTNICMAYSKGIIGTAYGLSAALQGGHADYFQVQNADIGALKIPDGVTEEQALLMTDALATGYYGVKMAKVKAGDTVVVIGQGPVGLMAAEAAYALGAAKVYTIEPNSSRRLISESIGAIAMEPEAAIPFIMEDSQGLGVDAVIDAVGRASTIKQALKLAKFGGHVAILGIIQPTTKIPLFYAQMKSITVHGGIATIAGYWPEVIPLIQNGKIQGKQVFTHNFNLKDGSEAFRLFEAQEDGVMKIIMTP